MWPCRGQSFCQRWRKFLDGPDPRPPKSLCYPGDLYFFLGLNERRFWKNRHAAGGSLVTSLVFCFIRSGWLFPWRRGIFEEFSVFFWVSYLQRWHLKKDPKLHIWHIQKKCPSKTSFKKKCQNIFSTYRKDPRRRGNLIHTWKRNRKINLEPENTLHPFPEEDHLPKHNFQVLCESLGVCGTRDLPSLFLSLPTYLPPPHLGKPNQSRTCFPKMQSPAKGSKELMITGVVGLFRIRKVGCSTISGEERRFITLFTLENIIYLHIWPNYNISPT